jgi:hypothetical protein
MNIRKITHHAYKTIDVCVQLDRFISIADEMLEHVPDLPHWARESLTERITLAQYALESFDENLVGEPKA